MRQVVLATVSFWISITTASAQDLSWVGPGAASCTQYAQSVRSGGEDMHSFFFSWAQGFLSGLNTRPLLSGKPTNLAARPTNYQQAFIDRYCDERPLATYVNAVLSLYDTMRSEQGLHDWRQDPKY
jgi:hypothetical protein